MAENKNLIEEKYVGDPVDIGTSKDRYENFLLEGETVVLEYKGIRDAAIFTDKRLMVIDPQGLRGRKVELASFPWKSISAFTVENSGTFDLDAELKICGSGFGIIKLSFTRGVDMSSICKLINSKIL